MSERDRIYDKICFTLTEYETDESVENRDTGWAAVFYDLLVDISTNWEMVITADR